MAKTDILTQIRDKLVTLISTITVAGDNYFDWESTSVNPKWRNYNLAIESAGGYEAAHPICFVRHGPEIGISPTTATGKNGGRQENDLTFFIEFYPYVDHETDMDDDEEINKCIRDLKNILLENRTLDGTICNLFYNETNRYVMKQNKFGLYCGVMDITVRYRQLTTDIDTKA